MTQLQFLAMLLVASTSTAVCSQGMEFYTPQGALPGDTGFDNVQQEGAPRLRAALGAGIAVAPTFPGSDGYRAHLAPAIGRDESDDPHLQGLGNVDRTWRGGAFAVYFREGYLARGSISTDIAGHHQGTLARFDVYARRPFGEGIVLFAGPGITWGDRNYTQTFFGVTAAQSASSGLPQFDAGAGIGSARLSAGAIYRLAPRWRLLSSYSYARLTGDAGSSPITESRNQHFVAVSAVYLVR